MPEATKTAVLVRLRPDALAVLEREVISPLPTIPKTELEAGFALGVYHVLKRLRDGYTTEL